MMIVVSLVTKEAGFEEGASGDRKLEREFDPTQ